jgi:hypothetical protein
MLGSHGIKVSVEKIRKNIDPMKVSPTGSYISMLKEATGFGLPADKKNKEEVKDKAKNDKIIKNLEAVNDVFVESKKSRFSFEKDSADSKKTEKKEISSKDIGKINKILSKDGERSTKRTLRTLLRKPESDEYRGAFDNIAPDEKSPLISRVLAKASASPEAVGELLKTIALTPAKSLFIKDSGGRYPLEIAQDRESKDRAFAPIVKAITQKRKQLVLTEDAFETRDDMKQGIPATLSTDVEPVSVNVHNIPKSTTVLGQTSPLSTGRSTGLGSVNK